MTSPKQIQSIFGKIREYRELVSSSRARRLSRVEQNRLLQLRLQIEGQISSRRLDEPQAAPSAAPQTPPPPTRFVAPSRPSDTPIPETLEALDAYPTEPHTLGAMAFPPEALSIKS